jgi:hypothetical protein
MTHIDLDVVVARLMDTTRLLSDLLAETDESDRVGRGLRGLDLLVASGVQAIALGRRSNTSEVIVLGQVRGFTRVAIGNLDTIIEHGSARVLRPRLVELIASLSFAVESEARS